MKRGTRVDMLEFNGRMWNAGGKAVWGITLYPRLPVVVTGEQRKQFFGVDQQGFVCTAVRSEECDNLITLTEDIPNVVWLGYCRQWHLSHGTIIYIPENMMYVRKMYEEFGEARGVATLVSVTAQRTGNVYWIVHFPAMASHIMKYGLKMRKSGPAAGKSGWGIAWNRRHSQDALKSSRESLPLNQETSLP